MIRIRDLSTTPLPAVVDCLLKAFEGYFVPMPTELHVWEQRFGRSGVDWSRSYGAFEEGELVAFIIHAIGEMDGKRTAFNTGTGVVPEHRGKHLVDVLYAHALPELKRSGVDLCTLEVITKNAPAVRVYERVGFAAVHTLKSFLGEPKANDAGEPLQARELHEVDLGDDRWYSWDHRVEALTRSMGGYVLFTLGGAQPWGHVIADPSTGRVARLAVKDEADRDQWIRLISSLGTFQKPLRLVNVHPERSALIEAVLGCGLVNDIDQFEMRMTV
jgi:GNAT superfamily N-acetyltransferase